LDFPFSTITFVYYYKLPAALTVLKYAPMKKRLLQNLLFTFILSLLLCVSCKKETDTTPPDNSDGAVSVTNDYSDLKPDTGTAGNYIINYYASDVNGNKAHASRTVMVEIWRDDYPGNYNAVNSCPSVGAFSSVETVSAGASDDKIIISNFASTNENCTATISGQNITIESQQIGIFNNVHGTGTINNKATVISLSYTYTYNALTETCTATLTRQ
jgi:hypothetical protein